MLDAPSEPEEEEPIVGSPSHQIMNTQRKEQASYEKRASITKQVFQDPTEIEDLPVEHSKPVDLDVKEVKKS